MNALLALVFLAAPVAALPALESIPALSGLILTGGPAAVADVVGRAVTRLPVRAFDRSGVPAEVQAELAKVRSAILADAAEPAVRFPMPLTKVFVERVTARLLVSSGFEAGAVVALVEDRIWGMPTAKMNAGVLIVEPEGVAIMRSEDEAAALIAHEIAHHLLGHAEKIHAVAQRHPRTGGGGGDLFSGGSRMSREEQASRVAQELEADVLSVTLLANAGYDANAAEAALRAVRFEMETDPRYDFYNRPSPVHPDPETRYRAMSAEMKRLRLSAVGRTPLDVRVFEELKNRRRPGPGGSAAHDLHQHYQRPRP